MPDFRAMYYSLYGDVCDAIAALQAAQQKAEQIYFTSEDICLPEPQKNDPDAE